MDNKSNIIEIISLASSNRINFFEYESFFKRNISLVRLFYEEYNDEIKWQQLVAKLSRKHKEKMLKMILNEKISGKESNTWKIITYK